MPCKLLMQKKCCSILFYSFLVSWKTSPSDHVIPKTKQYVASKSFLDFSFAEELETGREFEVELLYFNIFFVNKVYI